MAEGRRSKGFAQEEEGSEGLRKQMEHGRPLGGRGKRGASCSVFGNLEEWDEFLLSVRERTEGEESDLQTLEHEVDM